MEHEINSMRIHPSANCVLYRFKCQSIQSRSQDFVRGFGIRIVEIYKYTDFKCERCIVYYKSERQGRKV